MSVFSKETRFPMYSNGEYFVSLASKTGASISLVFSLFFLHFIKETKQLKVKIISLLISYKSNCLLQSYFKVSDA